MKIFARLGRRLRHVPKRLMLTRATAKKSLEEQISHFRRRWDVPWTLDTAVFGLCGLEACSALTNFGFKWYVNSVGSIDPGVHQGLQLLFYCSGSAMKLGGLYGICYAYKPIQTELFFWRLSRTSLLYGLVGVSLFGGAAFFFPSHLSNFEEYSNNEKVKRRMIPFCTTFAATSTFVNVNLAGVVEEILYRGFLLATLTNWVATPTALLLSSVGFACSHVGAARFNLSIFPQHFYFGLFAGAIYLHTRNLCAPIILHCCYNSSVFVYYLLEFKRVCPNGFDEQDLDIKPFKPMKDLDQDEVVAKIVKDIGGE